MTQKALIELVDDLNGGPAAETVEFALDGVTYLIDLTAENADRRRGVLNRFIGSARRVGGRKVVRQTESVRPTAVESLRTKRPRISRSATAADCRLR